MSDSNTEDPTPDNRPTRAPTEISPEIRDEIVKLKKEGYGSRTIVPRLSAPLSRDLVQRVLREEGLVSKPTMDKEEPSKLEAFLPQVARLVDQHLTTTRILREIRSAGFTGQRTILAEHVAKLRAEQPLAAKKKPIKRRFETAPGEEMQIDWSPYTISIGGRPTKVRALGVLLCFSRKLFLAFFRDERQPTLLEGLARAMEYFQGAALRVVLDNMSTAVLGRIGPERKPLWHPRFLDFARHYGFEPYACAVRDPDRKGKKEKSFQLVEADLLRGSEFASWEDLEQRTKVWLDATADTANLRVHGTTRRVPNEVWQSERERLIRLPDQRFAVHEDGVRVIDRDSTLSIHGTRYTVPSALAEQSVGVRLYAEHFEVLDRQGRITFSRAYAPDADKGKVIIDPTHYATLPRRPRGAAGGERLDEAFVKRFPDLAPLIEGIKLRTKTLAPIHIRHLLRLVDRYGEEPFLAAARRALEFRSFRPRAIVNILEATVPLPEPDPIAPLGGAGAMALGEVESGSLDTYDPLDLNPATSETPPPVPSAQHDGEEGGDHGA